MQIPFCGPTYLGRSTNINSEKCLNFFIEKGVIGTEKSDISLVGVPGTKTFAQLLKGEIRALYNCNGYMYTVVADSLYMVNPTGAFSYWLGKLEDSSGSVFIADNGKSTTGTIGGNQMMLLSNGKGYIYNTVDQTFKKITDPVFSTIYNPKSLTYQDGYFIVSEDSQRFFVSDMYDGTTWSALAFASAITTPDNIQIVISINQMLYVIKNWSTEVFQNSGTTTKTGSPFIRVSGGVFPYGTVAPNSVCYGLDSVFFLANQGHSSSSEFIGVVVLQGYSPAVISTPSITYKISKLSNIQDARGYFYSDEGHGFYVLTFPSSDLTLCYDITTKMWHERSTSNLTDNNQHRHLGQYYTNCYNKHFLTHYTQPKIVELSTDYTSDDGVPILSERISPIIYDKNEDASVFINKLSIEVEGGVGTPGVTTYDTYAWVADGSHQANGGDMNPAIPYSFGYAGGFNLVSNYNTNPMAWLSWSNDSGHTWSNEYSASIGKMGEYKTRLVWRKLGRARNRVFKLAIKNSIKKIVLDATVEGGL